MQTCLRVGFYNTRWTLLIMRHYASCINGSPIILIPLQDPLQTVETEDSQNEDDSPAQRSRRPMCAKCTRPQRACICSSTGVANGCRRLLEGSREQISKSARMKTGAAKWLGTGPDLKCQLAGFALIVLYRSTCSHPSTVCYYIYVIYVLYI